MRPGKRKILFYRMIGIFKRFQCCEYLDHRIAFNERVLLLNITLHPVFCFYNRITMSKFQGMKADPGRDAVVFPEEIYPEVLSEPAPTHLVITMPEPVTRPVADPDRDAVIGIFNHYITTSFAAYPDKPVPPAFFTALKEGAYAFDVIEADGEIVGFGMLKQFLPFGTFLRTATVTTFIGPSHRHQGYGTMLMEAMIKEAKKRGIIMLLANISSKNTESLVFHKKYGFFECGRMYEVGMKFSELFDVVWMQKDLAPRQAVLKEETIPLPD